VVAEVVQVYFRHHDRPKLSDAPRKIGPMTACTPRPQLLRNIADNLYEYHLDLRPWMHRFDAEWLASAVIAMVQSVADSDGGDVNRLLADELLPRLDLRYIDPSIVLALGVIAGGKVQEAADATVSTVDHEAPRWLPSLDAAVELRDCYRFPDGVEFVVVRGEESTWVAACFDSRGRIVELSIEDGAEDGADFEPGDPAVRSVEPAEVRRLIERGIDVAGTPAPYDTDPYLFGSGECDDDADEPRGLFVSFVPLLRSWVRHVPLP
jgi:hypothetical protein